MLQLEAGISRLTALRSLSLAGITIELDGGRLPASLTYLRLSGLDAESVMPSVSCLPLPCMPLSSLHIAHAHVCSRVQLHACALGCGACGGHQCNSPTRPVARLRLRCKQSVPSQLTHLAALLANPPRLCSWTT